MKWGRCDDKGSLKGVVRRGEQGSIKGVLRRDGKGRVVKRSCKGKRWEE